MFGWALLVLSLNKLFALKKILELKVFQYIGKHSFAYYSVHWPIVISGTCILTVKLLQYTSLSYAKAAIVSVIITVPVIMLVAVLVDKYIYPSILKGAKRIYQKLSDV